MPTANSGTLTTINYDTRGTWQSRTCSGFLQPLNYDITAGEACTFPSGGIYQDNNGTGDCFECIGYTRTEVRTLKEGTNTDPLYVKVYVTFDEQGGSAVSNKYVYYGNSRTYGTLPTPTRTNYSFNGWYTAASGGSLIVSSSVVTTTNLTQTLYAQWTSTAPTQWTYIGTGTQSYNSSTSINYTSAPFCPSNSVQISLATSRMNSFNPSNYTSGHIFRVRVGAGTSFPDTFCSYRYYRAD